MKKIIFFLWLCFASCSTAKVYTNDSEVFKAYKKPFKIISIGVWNEGYHILTLADSNSKYFLVKVPLDKEIKIGDLYEPK